MIYYLKFIVKHEVKYISINHHVNTIIYSDEMNENTLIENAILAFLHHYPEHNWADDYKVLLSKVRTLNEQPKDTPNKKRGRPAKRARTQKASSTEASQETT